MFSAMSEQLCSTARADCSAATLPFSKASLAVATTHTRQPVAGVAGDHHRNRLLVERLGLLVGINPWWRWQVAIGAGAALHRLRSGVVGARRWLSRWLSWRSVRWLAWHGVLFPADPGSSELVCVMAPDRWRFGTRWTSGKERVVGAGAQRIWPYCTP